MLAASKTVRIALCLPWYNGPDRDTSAAYMEFYSYLGRLAERSWWLHHTGQQPSDVLQLPKLNPPAANLRDDESGVTFEFISSVFVAYSLPGTARETAVQWARKVGAHYVLMWDDDMLFDFDLLLQLWRNQVPICAALAFTSREPIQPVIYRFIDFDIGQRGVSCGLEVVHEYEKDALQQVDAVGAGVILIETSVFDRIPRPWFMSTGHGEDIHFCIMAKTAGVPVYVDTRIKTAHKPTFPVRWHDEAMYLESREPREVKG